MNSRQQFNRRQFIGISAAALGSLALAGCGGNEGSSDAESADGAGATGDGDKGTIHIGWLTWDEDIAITALWRRLLEEQGYNVKLTQAEAGPIYESLYAKDIDLFLDGWTPVTHSDYLDQYGDSLEELGIWYDNAILTWAVPEYVDINSIEDLKGRADEFDSRIIGIEPGAGVTRISINEVMPGYNLEDEYEFIEGSTTAMLAELQRATQKEEPIVVTLWRPHWAYSAYPIKDLEDPKTLLGEAEELKAFAREGFSEDYPEVAKWFANFKLTDQQLSDLESLVIDEYGTGKEQDAIDEWLSNEENRSLADSWITQ